MNKIYTITISYLMILTIVFTSFVSFISVYSDQKPVYAGSPFVRDVFASPYEEECALALNRLNLLFGYEDGTFRPQNTLTRAEFVALIVRVMAIESTYTSFSNPFSDVSSGDWFYKVVCISYDRNYVGGYPDNTFRPSASITYAEAVSILVRLLGHGSNLRGNWPDNYISRAAEIGLTANIRLSADTAIKRGECFILICDALSIEIKR